MKNDIVLFSVVHQDSGFYIDDFFESLNNQSFSNFDIFLINDNFLDLNKCLKKYSKLNILSEFKSDGIAKNREAGIKSLLELNYKKIIFADSDDYFSPNRVEISNYLLEKYDLVYNELNLFNERFFLRNYFEKRIHNYLNPFENIYDTNLFGFTNTCVRASIIPKNILFDPKLIAVDWFLFSILFLNNKNLNYYFEKDIKSYYRQHKKNTIGLDSEISHERLEKVLNTKDIHYQSLITYCIENNMKSHLDIFNPRLNLIHNLKKKFTDTSFKKKYHNFINDNKNILNTGWWFEIITNKYNYDKNKFNI